MRLACQSVGAAGLAGTTQAALVGGFTTAGGAIGGFLGMKNKKKEACNESEEVGEEAKAKNDEPEPTGQEPESENDEMHDETEPCQDEASAESEVFSKDDGAKTTDCNVNGKDASRAKKNGASNYSLLSLDNANVNVTLFNANVNKII